MARMSFYAESTHIAKKPHKCEFCGGEIKAGEEYIQERGVFYNDFFSRDMHIHCHNMEALYCEEVDNEFCWYEISDYIQGAFCNKYRHAACNDDLPDWEECETSIFDCKLIINALNERRKTNGKSE